MALSMLTDKAVKAVKPTGKEFVLSDGGGLYLIVKPGGAKSWSFRFTCPVTRKVSKMGLGGYPAVSLALARELAQIQREQVAKGLDPRRAREREREQRLIEDASTFGVRAELWFQWKLKRKAWTSEDSRARVRGLLDNHTLPWLKDRPLAEITRREVSVLLERVVGQGLKDTPHRVRWVIEQVFNYAVEFAEFPDERNFMRGRNVGALKRHKTKHHAAIFDPIRIGQLMRDIQTVRGSLITRTARGILPYLWQRPGMIRKMEWQELDLDSGLWTVPASKMKMRDEHVVPLPFQAIALLRDLQPLTGSVWRGPVSPMRREKKRKLARTCLREQINLKHQMVT